MVSVDREPVIRTARLTKRYDNGSVAVDAVNMRVNRGEVYGFLGPNGAGKTTTLRMLTGLTRPTSGTAYVTGKPLGSLDSLAKVGCLIESPAFYPYLSGRDNLHVIADYAGVPHFRVEDALDLVDLTPRAKDRYQTYSLGMKQRLGLAAATLKDPELLILDEPTNGLDPQGMADMRELIKQIAEGGRTVLISSHLLSEVEQMCTHVGVIQRGRLIAEGPISELRRGPTKLEVRCPQQERAEVVLRDLLGAAAVERVDGSFLLSIDLARAAEINRVLIQSGVDVSRLANVERSLEQTFLELTGGEMGL
ncbi:MAG TPA: ABC transporter ATP-binding protein [Candidatus Dormibacteraeota bacterium]|jgi:ABC-2 type transport system ATP-binding protein|nr:ABC transporter ATP-binding protein [Candidatus Dormibacteraeota bacterium]